MTTSENLNQIANKLFSVNTYEELMAKGRIINGHQALKATPKSEKVFSEYLKGQK